MQERQNYPYYNNNSLKDINQSGQGGLNKQGKKSNYKYANKNNQNNMDDKVNMNSGEHSQNYPHYRPRQNRKNFQDPNAPFKKKNNNKKRRDNNNEFQYQNNNSSEISQSSKDVYLEQQNNSNLGNNINNNNSNNHQNIYNKQYKKNNQILYNNINNGTVNNISNMNNINNNQNINNNANTNLTNINNPNLTPQRHNQMTNPFGLGQNLQNNINNLNQLGKSPISSMIAQQNQISQPTSQNQIYINPNLIMRQSYEQEMNMKDEKSSDNLSEETLSTRGGNHQNEGGNLQINKNNNEFINQELLINNRFLQQQPNYLSMHYNMNNINNINSLNNSLGNINNINNMNNNYNNINNMQNISNYSPNLVNQINNLNNLGNLNNLSMGNFQMPIYDQQNNQLFNVMASNLKQNYPMPINDGINVGDHKKIKKMGNKSPNEQNFSLNPALNLGNVLPNLNYNGPTINNGLNANNINNKKISLSSQAPKNTIPNFNQGENLNLAFNPNKMNQQGISPLLNMNMNSLGKNFYMQQNMKNPHLNNNLWNNLNNNNHMNGPNNNLNNNNLNDNFQGNKNNNLYNKKDFNNRINHNNNQNNNKKYPKTYNHNTYQPSNMNGNHLNNKNKMNQNMDISNNLNGSNDSNNFLQKKNNNNASNSSNIVNNNVLRNNKPQKKYLLSLRIKINNNETEIINIKSLKDTNALLQEIKEKRNLSDKTVKLIQKKINNAVEIIKKIFDYNLNKYTYKNLVDINHQLISHKDKNEKDDEKIKRGIDKTRHHSSKYVNKFFENEKNLAMNDVKNVEFLNISY